MKHWLYLKYVLRHKWYVFLYGWQLSIPWLAALHDNSKFRPDEFGPYSEFFYGDIRGSAERTPVVKAAFDMAWLLHQKRNKHHWQWWLLTNSQDAPRVLDMPDRYRREMLADWRGAGRAINGVEDTFGWYCKNRDKMTLHPDTRAWIEDQLKFRPEECG